MVDRGSEHMLQLVFVLRGHDHHIGYGSHVGEIKGTVMGGPVGSHQTSSVQGKNHVEVLETDVMKDLIIGPLQEGGIDGHHGNESLRGHACCKGHRVLLCEADIVNSVGYFLRHLIQTSSTPHGRRNPDDFWVFFCQLDQGATKNLGVGWHRAL